jgi:hypothetical protein
MKEHERSHLETKLKELRGTLTSLADGAGFEQFIRTIHKPGFTTVAEAALLIGVAEAMHEHSVAAQTGVDLRRRKGRAESAAVAAVTFSSEVRRPVSHSPRWAL